jgi:hypothetical protein
MQAARFEGSLMTSLAELKSIEQQRLADERTAVLRAEELRKQALIDADRRIREEAEAKAKAEYDQQLALEQARVQAERELRLRIESAEQAERARQQMALEQERHAQELALRKAEVAKKRPTWMVAVTAIALACAAVLVVLTVQAFGATDDADKARREAELISQRKELEAEQMRKELDRLEQDLKSLDASLAVALDKVAIAQTRAEAAAAAGEVKRLANAKREAEIKAAELRRKREYDERIRGVQVDKDCEGQSVCRKVMKK